MTTSKSFATLASAVLISCALMFQTRGIAASDEEEIRRGEVIVELQPGASIDAVNDRNRTTTIAQIIGTNFYRLRVPKIKKENKWRKRLAQDSSVLSASLNPVVTSPSLFARATASFPEGFATPGLSIADFQAQQRLFESLQLEDVAVRSRGAGTVVAIIDTGVDRSHPALASHLWTNPAEAQDGIDNDGDGLIDDLYGWNFADNNGDTSESAADPQTTVAGHGTFIAGLVAMLAPETRIMPLRAFPASGISDAFTVAAAVKYAADHGADVINLSLGSPQPSDLLLDAIMDARKRGITVVAAVGNDGSESAPQFPSSLDAVIAVAAIELNGHKASFSNFGPHVDLCAPGSNIISTFPGGAGYARWSGTSFAAPLVSAEAALVTSADPRQKEVSRVVEGTADNIDGMNPGLSGKLGHGRIDPLAALISLNASLPFRDVLDTHVLIDLARGPAGDSSNGKASVTIEGARQEFAVQAHMLSARTSYSLFVDGVSISTDLSASLGTLTFTFSSDSGPLPPSISPVTKIRHVELRDSLARVVLVGDFSAQPASPGTGFLEKEAHLAATFTMPQASGNASAKIEAVDVQTRRQQLGVAAEGLTSGVGYRLVVDGINTATVFAKSGFIRIVLTSDGSSGLLLPDALKPVTNIRHIELFDDRGLLVLQGSFAND